MKDWRIPLERGDRTITLVWWIDLDLNRVEETLWMYWRSMCLKSVRERERRTQDIGKVRMTCED